MAMAEALPESNRREQREVPTGQREARREQRAEVQGAEESDHAYREGWAGFGLSGHTKSSSEPRSSTLCFHLCSHFCPHLCAHRYSSALASALPSRAYNPLLSALLCSLLSLHNSNLNSHLCSAPSLPPKDVPFLFSWPLSPTRCLRARSFAACSEQTTWHTR
jgi:hypothetical protein